ARATAHRWRRQSRCARSSAAARRAPRRRATRSASRRARKKRSASAASGAGTAKPTTESLSAATIKSQPRPERCSVSVQANGGAMDTQLLTQEQIIAELNDVLQVDIDAVGAYSTAIDSIDELEIKRQLGLFKSDHERHITDLKAAVVRFGG